MKVSKTNIEFIGDYISQDDVSGRLTALAKRMDLMAIAFQVVGLELVGFIPDTQVLVEWILASSIQIAAARFTERRFLLSAFSTDQIANKCIETKPDKNLLGNINQFRSQAKYVKENYVLFNNISIAGIVVIGGIVRNLELSLISLLGLLPLLVRGMEGYRRWQKVEKGDWRIADKRPPSKPGRGPIKLSIP